VRASCRPDACRERWEVVTQCVPGFGQHGGVLVALGGRAGLQPHRVQPYGGPGGRLGVANPAGPGQHLPIGRGRGAEMARQAAGVGHRQEQGRALIPVGGRGVDDSQGALKVDDGVLEGKAGGRVRSRLPGPEHGPFAGRTVAGHRGGGKVTCELRRVNDDPRGSSQVQRVGEVLVSAAPGGSRDSCDENLPEHVVGEPDLGAVVGQENPRLDRFVNQRGKVEALAEDTA
jgi:hypothetical protein